ncbi:MAG: hypothetical protein V1833_00320 [Elusimicrobiota bacterium]
MLQQNKIVSISILILILISTCVKAQESNIDRFENDLKEQQEEYRKSKKEEKEKLLTIEPFCKNLSQNVTWWHITAEEIQKIKNNGLGYSELIKVILISKKTEKAPDEIIKRRNRGDTFLKISERYNLDYSQIKNETKKIMSEVQIHNGSGKD